MELERLPLDARRPPCVPVSTFRYWLARVPPASVSPSRPASFLSGRIAIRLPPPCTQLVEERDLGVAERAGAEDHHLLAGELRRGDRAVGHVELVEALGAQDLRVVAAERDRRAR